VRDIINRVYRRVESRFIGEDRHRLDVCGLEMGKQLVQIRDVEATAGKVGALRDKRNRSMDQTPKGDKAGTHDFALERGV
jgi:hypothetical protein